MPELIHLVRYLALPEIPWPCVEVVHSTDLARIWRRAPRWRLGRRTVPARFGSFDVVCLGPVEGVRYRPGSYTIPHD